jgi:hypothetical protein
VYEDREQLVLQRATVRSHVVDGGRLQRPPILAEAHACCLLRRRRRRLLRRLRLFGCLLLPPLSFFVLLVLCRVTLGFLADERRHIQDLRVRVKIMGSIIIGTG